MSLNGALQVGRSSITASQAALQVAGNNMANAATPGFHRRTAHLAAAGDEIIARNQFVGQGVQLLRIRREVDTALQARLRDAVSQEHAAQIDQRFLTALETIQNELTENDLSTILSEFFNSFSELANNPEDNAVRAVVIQQGISVGQRVQQIRSDYASTIKEADRALGAAVTQVNSLLDQIASLNTQIAQTEQGQGEAAALRDQRDLIIDDLAKFIDVGVVEQPNGSMDVFVGSTPIVLAGESRGVKLQFKTEGEILVAQIRVASDGTLLDVTSGQIGALIEQRDQTIQPAIDALDEFAEQLIFQVNRVHSQGQGQIGFTSVTGTYAVDDTTVSMNLDASGIPFDIDNGSFFVHVTNEDTGIRTSYRIDVDGNSMSLNDLINEINVTVGIPNVTAGTGLKNELTLTATPGFDISFSDDTSGALAALGINTFFAGEDGSTIDVNQTLKDNNSLLAAGGGNVAGSNDTANAIANLQDTKFTELNNRSIREFWLDSVNNVSVKSGQANARVESSILVRESLSAQQQAVSGVSLDEEAINLLTFQRQFQAAARFISVIDEMIQTLLSLA